MIVWGGLVLYMTLQGWELKIHLSLQVQRLAPQEKNNPQFFMRPPHRPSSIDRTWWCKFKNFVSTRAQSAKKKNVCWRYIFPRKKVQTHMFSFTNRKKWAGYVLKFWSLQPKTNLAVYEGWHPGIHLVPEENKITPGNLRHQEVSACKLQSS